MSLIDRDLILRQLRALQQVLARAKKAESQQDLSMALGEIRDGYREALGVPYDLLSRVDVDSALLMLGSVARRSAYRDLLRAEAQTLRALGDTSVASAVELRLIQIDQAP